MSQRLRAARARRRRLDRKGWQYRDPDLCFPVVLTKTGKIAAEAEPPRCERCGRRLQRIARPVTYQD